MPGLETYRPLHQRRTEWVRRFRRTSRSRSGLRADHGAYSVTSAGPSLAAAKLCLAGLRSVSEIPRVAEVSRFLAGAARRAAAFRPGRALQTDQAGRDEGDQRRVRAALDKQGGAAKCSAAAVRMSGRPYALVYPYRAPIPVVLFSRVRPWNPDPSTNVIVLICKSAHAAAGAMLPESWRLPI